MNNWNSDAKDESPVNRSLCTPGAENALSDDTPENVRKFTKIDIDNATNKFSDLLGEGGFGTVYRGKIEGTVVAVKTLSSPEARDFIAELKTLTRFQHENLLSIIGYCDDPTCPSIVLEYMPNGSLADKLKSQHYFDQFLDGQIFQKEALDIFQMKKLHDKSKPLPWDVRLKIAYGAALGINHLHTSGEKPMVHRDIKSANILLNEHFVPKVADFGFVRDGDSGLSKVRPVTQTCYFTRFYEAPEVRDGDVSVKLDTYSFGMVLLELLTGLEPCHGDKPLRNYKKREILGRLLDSHTDWNKLAAEKLYKISKFCLKPAKKTRPTISQILGDLEACLSYISGDNYFGDKGKNEGGEYDLSSGEDIEEDFPFLRNPTDYSNLSAYGISVLPLTSAKNN